MHSFAYNINNRLGNFNILITNIKNIAINNFTMLNFRHTNLFLHQKKNFLTIIKSYKKFRRNNDNIIISRVEESSLRYSTYRKGFSTDNVEEKNSDNNIQVDDLNKEKPAELLSKKILEIRNKLKFSDLTINILKHLENNHEIYKNLCEESVKLSYEISENNNGDYIKEELLRVNKQINKFEKGNVHFADYHKLLSDIYSSTNFLEEAQEIGDDELCKSAMAELEQYYSELNNYQEELINFLIPNERADIDTIKLEIKSATGGLESTLFAEDLIQMYQKYCDKNYLKFDMEIYIPSESAARRGCKNGVFRISGENIYNYFKYESGVHKVQRVPITEKNGRIHSSTW